MKKVLLALAVLGVAACGGKDTAIKSPYPWRAVPFTEVHLDPDSFLGSRIAAVRDVTVPLAFSKCESEGRYANFVMAANPGPQYDVGSFMGFPFDDTDVYKTIEGASYLLQTFPDERLEHYIDSVLDMVAAAQEPDGYLYTARTINPGKPHSWSGQARWEKEEELSHELYNLGHMVDAACAHYQATGSTKFLDIARRYADCVLREVGPDKGQARVVPGHQIAEMALARLYALTGEKKYLDEAKFFLDMRGKTDFHEWYNQTLKPVLEETDPIGHAVRAGYQYAGMADIAALTGEKAYVDAIDSIWSNIVSKKYYLTGGIGSRHDGEAFGDAYELPNLTAYNETCAAISMVYFFQRMFQLHGEAKYIDCLERTLYNGVLAGMSKDGGKFFYPNPLESDGLYHFNSDNTITRQPWFGCACCPSNLCRFIPSLPGYFYAVKDKDIFVNLFGGSTTETEIDGAKVQIKQRTNYPGPTTNGVTILDMGKETAEISVMVKTDRPCRFRLRIRIPGWARGEVAPGGLYNFADREDGRKCMYLVLPEEGGSLQEIQETDIEDGYLTIDNVWTDHDMVIVALPMQPRLVEADYRVEADRGKAAVEAGPLVYCAEWPDNRNVDAAVLHGTPHFGTNFDYEIMNTEGDGSPFKVASISADGLTLIPYYAWAHRGPGKMKVWIDKTD